MFTPFKLNTTLGRAYNANLDDTFRTKQALAKLGHYEMPGYGFDEYPDEPLFQGIEELQELHGLQQDGIIKPDGETATKLGQVLAEKMSRKVQPVPNALGLTADVGINRTNTPHDTFSVSQALDWAGFPNSVVKGHSPTTVTGGLTGTIKRFQKSEGLKVDGWLHPFGETEKALNFVLKPKVETLNTASIPQGGPADTPEAPSAQAGQQQAMAPVAIPAIIYEVAQYFGMAVMAAWAWWQSMTSSQQEQIKKQMAGQNSGGGDEEICDHLHYEVDRPVCNEIKRKRGSEAAQRCYASANERYAACLKGVPLDRLPPLDIWNN